MFTSGTGARRNQLHTHQEAAMSVATANDLVAKKCKPCEGGVEPMSAAQVSEQLKQLPGWRLSADGKSIRREWVVKNFLAGMKFFEEVAHAAEEDNHHPDLHLTGYRNVAIELSTHAIGGLSENDFILAAKIDRLPVETKKPA
jgi:4a-hydroxytetrahydrobiopterin dehydratase